MDGGPYLCIPGAVSSDSSCIVGRLGAACCSAGALTIAVSQEPSFAVCPTLMCVANLHLEASICTWHGVHPIIPAQFPGSDCHT